MVVLGRARGDIPTRPSGAIPSVISPARRRDPVAGVFLMITETGVTR